MGIELGNKSNDLSMSKLSSPQHLNKKLTNKMSRYDIKATTIKELIKILNSIKDKEQTFFIWGSINDDGTGRIQTNEKDIKNYE